MKKKLKLHFHVCRLCITYWLRYLSTFQIDELNISMKSKTVKKFYQGSYIMILTDLSNAIKKLWEKFRFINTLIDVKTNVN